MAGNEHAVQPHKYCRAFSCHNMTILQHYTPIVSD